MQSDFRPPSRPPRIGLQYKLVLTHLAVTLAAVLIAEAMALGILALIQPPSVDPYRTRYGTPVARYAVLASVLMGVTLAGLGVFGLLLVDDIGAPTKLWAVGSWSSATFGSHSACSARALGARRGEVEVTS